MHGAATTRCGLWGVDGGWLYSNSRVGQTALTSWTFRRQLRPLQRKPTLHLHALGSACPALEIVFGVELLATTQPRTRQMSRGVLPLLPSDVPCTLCFERRPASRARSAAGARGMNGQMAGSDPLGDEEEEEEAKGSGIDLRMSKLNV